MSYSNPNQNPIQETYTPSNSNESDKLKLYQAFIFSISICVTLVVLFVIYIIYLRRYSIDWSSLRMHGSTLVPTTNNNLSTAELGLSKDVRDMLPIVIFKKSFSINDLQCSVCLGEYQEDEKLQQIPACGHIFHMECIDLWLSSHTTCPLCRLSLIPKESLDRSDQSLEIVSSIDNSSGEASAQLESQSTSEAASHNINDGQEDNQDIQEVSKEMEENDRNNQSGS